MLEHDDGPLRGELAGLQRYKTSGINEAEIVFEVLDVDHHMSSLLRGLHVMQNGQS